jgi:hypothetical protein
MILNNFKKKFKRYSNSSFLHSLFLNFISCSKDISAYYLKTFIVYVKILGDFNFFSILGGKIGFFCNLGMMSTYFSGQKGKESFWEEKLSNYIPGRLLFSLH